MTWMTNHHQHMYQLHTEYFTFIGHAVSLQGLLVGHYPSTYRVQTVYQVLKEYVLYTFRVLTGYICFS